MVYPWEKEEYKKARKWSSSSKKKILQSTTCITGWADICGYGQILEKCGWDLNEMQKEGYIHLLNKFHELNAYPILPIPGLLCEKILILNDGLARTCDIVPSTGLVYFGLPFIFFIRELFFKFHFSKSLCISYGLGLRMVFAGGERMQYSSEVVTGSSFLLHDENRVSPLGEELLSTNYLYNPSEFQINTAFSKAYTIDRLGTHGGFPPNNCYVERGFWDICKLIPHIDFNIEKNYICLLLQGKEVIRLYIDKTHQCQLLGLNVTVDQISGIRLNIPTENEEVYMWL
ncbi:TPA: hypothetical protein I8Y89_001419 [Legionella pneumophila]|nr:hypothetical protein [Legionella pneumophila]